MRAQQASHLANSPGPADKARQHGRKTMHATGRCGHHRLPHPRTIMRAAAAVQPSRTKRQRCRWPYPGATREARSLPAGRPTPTPGRPL